jgi:hypothetical protein
MNSKEKIKYNKKMIGQRVLVTQGQMTTFEAVVVDVVNEDTLMVQEKGSQEHVIVDLYDVRSLEYGKH